MKKAGIFIIILLFLANLFSLTVHAEESYDLSGVYNSLSDEAKSHMLSLGADSADVNTLSQLSFEGVMNEIASIAAENAQAPLKGLISVTAMLLIASLLTAYKGALGETGTVLNLTLSLCLGAAVAIPAAQTIQSAGDIIANASQLMLAYIPVTVLLLVSSGSAAGSAAYYASVLGLSEGITQLSSHVILPFLNMLLGLGLAGGVSDGVNLDGFGKTLSKAAKWLLSFAMAVFTAVLGIRQVLANSVDSVANRAAKFALSSFVPVVGSALSEALKTVQGSVSVLKSGVGVFVILALAVTFLPVLLRTLLWIFTLWLGKSTAEALNLPQGTRLLGGLSDVFSTLTAVMLCVMTVYIISTALLFLMGGAS